MVPIVTSAGTPMPIIWIVLALVIVVTLIHAWLWWIPKKFKNRFKKRRNK